MSNWVERRADRETQIRRDGFALWNELHAALEDAIQSFGARFGTTGRVQVVGAKRLNGDTRYQITVEEVSSQPPSVGKRIGVLELKFDPKAAVITFEWTQCSFGRGGEIRLDVKDTKTVLVHNERECSTDEASEIILKEAFFGRES